MLGDALTKTRLALDSGLITPAELERFLDEAQPSRRFGFAGLLRALGLSVVLGGVTFLYGIEFHSLSLDARKLTPFLFPLAALAFALVLDLLDRPRWEVGFAALVCEVALALAFLAASSGWGATATFGAAAGLIGLAVSMGIYVRLRLVRLTTWGMSISLVAITAFLLASSSRATHEPALFLVEALALAAAGWTVAGRHPAVARQALYIGCLLALLAGVLGVVLDAFNDPVSPDVSIWALELFATSIVALALAAALELSGLVWFGSLAALACFGAIAGPANDAESWAIAIVLAGVLLTAAGVLLGRHALSLPRLPFAAPRAR